MKPQLNWKFCCLLLLIAISICAKISLIKSVDFKKPATEQTGDQLEAKKFSLNRYFISNPVLTLSASAERENVRIDLNNLYNQVCYQQVKFFQQLAQLASAQTGAIAIQQKISLIYQFHGFW